VSLPVSQYSVDVGQQRFTDSETVSVRMPANLGVNREEAALERLRSRVKISTKPKGQVRNFSQTISLTLYPQHDYEGSEMSELGVLEQGEGISTAPFSGSLDIYTNDDEPQLLPYTEKPPLSSTPSSPRNLSPVGQGNGDDKDGTKSLEKSTTPFEASLSLTPSNSDKSPTTHSKPNLECNENLPEDDSELLLFADPFNAFDPNWVGLWENNPW